MMPRSTVALLIAGVLALGSCGGDSGGDDGQSGGGGPYGEGAATTGPTGATGPGALDQNTDPVPEESPPPADRGDKPRRATRDKPAARKDLKPAQRTIHDQTKLLCEQVGLERLRQEYRIETRDPEAVAREVARRTYQRGARTAVFSGCLAGLRGGN